ncbi:uncharacterized protein B0H18DRAFT_955167 [Fomitopsis serialis]|uniref:uncharacterized protein n=1 Tax=Fomitopsis serialis TaxID=139415 RepID=UPI0020080882|nr:uncharacterized protein B0H18DRAFT_955167 [Neoantrodia serialis]KAH9925320.1 hypothetical protein B0H18DRAFT_955167 [Neoantrodia serialis]
MFVFKFLGSPAFVVPQSRNSRTQCPLSCLLAWDVPCCMDSYSSLLVNPEYARLHIPRADTLTDSYGFLSGAYTRANRHNDESKSSHSTLSPSRHGALSQKKLSSGATRSSLMNRRRLGMSLRHISVYARDVGAWDVIHPKNQCWHGRIGRIPGYIPPDSNLTRKYTHWSLCKLRFSDVREYEAQSEAGGARTAEDIIA